ncbi:acyl-CoA dehydrogenase family protein [Sphingosinicella soli]|uniref:Alkylation response protein AidB-like acyl-CoA dehydrogenase n=1 Tax=Sphingosinicella soli TaxID=333708 RepID=A0A7W7F7R3_9SPHN|nr:alkylation response protein AidB-like acyl-CoA dehydrogenase [Sphingosinicella soli]
MDCELLSIAKSLSPLVEQEALTTERDGTLSPAVVDAFKESKLFWMLVPKDLGGLGTDIVTSIEVLEEVTRADGSSGWSLMANSGTTAVAAAYLGERAVDAMFGGRDLPIAAGMLGPGGRSVEVSGGFQGSGKFAFGSGCAHADWFGAGMFVLDDGKPRLLADGTPEVRVCFVPKEQVNILGGWDVMGLIGTGSYDYELPDQFIARDSTLERSSTEPLRGGPVFELGLPGFACAGHAAMALGLMKRALQEIARISSAKKRPGYPSTISEYPLFLKEFGLNEAAYWGARAYVLDVFSDAQDTVNAEQPLSPEQRARFRQSTTWLHQVAADVVSFCHLWGGSESIRNPSVLGRCLRDMYVATQHVFVDPITVVDATRAILPRWNISEH